SLAAASTRAARSVRSILNCCRDIALAHGRDVPGSRSPQPSARRSPAGLTRLVDRAPAFGPILERAEVVDLAVAHVCEHLAAQGRAPAGGAIATDGFVLGEILVVVGRPAIRSEPPHP